MLVKNPFAAAASDPQFLMLHAITGKDPADVMKPEIKGSSYLSIMPMFQADGRYAAAAGRHATLAPSVRTASGGGQNASRSAGDPTPANQVARTTRARRARRAASRAAARWRRAGSTSASGIFFFLVGLGLVTLARRRRA